LKISCVHFVCLTPVFMRLSTERSCLGKPLSLNKSTIDQACRSYKQQMSNGTRRWLSSLHREVAGICRKLLKGAHFTPEAQQHWQEDHAGV
jgi:hypothetical protein